MENKIVLAPGGIEAAAPSIQDVINSFIQECDVSKSSKRQYKKDLLYFFLWVQDTRRVISEMARADIINYKESLIDRQLEASTIGAYLTSVRLFFEWAEGNQFCANIARGVKGPKSTRGHKKDPLEVEDVKKLLKSIPKKTKIGILPYHLKQALIIV